MGMAAALGANFPPVPVITLPFEVAPVKTPPMRISTIGISLSAIALSAAAFWADGLSPGSLIVSSAIVGLAVFFHARTVESVRLQVGVAVVYLASFALGAVGALLIDKALGFAMPANFLQSSSAIPGVMLGWTICATFLTRAPAPQ